MSCEGADHGDQTFEIFPGSSERREYDEGFFGKMTHQMLRGIRVESKEELTDRIYKYFNEINKVPVVHHWKFKMDEIDPNEEVQIGLAI